MRTGNGDCFPAALNLLLEFHALRQLTSTEPVLVHGIVTGQGKIDGVQHWHAWVEIGDTVIDRSNDKDIKLPKGLYYSIGKIDQTWRYTPDEAWSEATDNDHYGPWIDNWEEMAC